MEYEKPYQYGKPVLISHWWDREEGYPLDNPKPNHPIASHYRTLGISDDVYVPKTSTQEQQETGIRRRAKRPPVLKRQVNFVSYPMNDFRFKRHFKEHTEPPPLPRATTTYSDFYKPPKPLIVRPDCCDEKLDPLLNRIPKSDFEFLPSSPNMFMDDHLTMISEGRKKINFLRQIRNSTYFMNAK